ncbi:MAG TPA: hypothetical protein DCR40_19540 [Prolixibacteraceae bacterium]|nr:hypothetical protein [Prolixibacteraceae bacterium]
MNFGLFSRAAAQEYFQQEVNFRINVSLNDKLHELNAFETIEYINHSPDTLNYLYFHLWPNGYSNNDTELAKQLFSIKGRQKLFNDPELMGYMDSLDFKVNGHQVQWNLLQGQPDVCQIFLKKPLLPGNSIQITTPFHVKIPKGITSRLGHIGESYQISQWYPKPAVYDRNGWHQMSNQDQGEFYSEFGSYDVSLTLPDNYIVASTGNLQNAGEIEMLNQLATDTSRIKNSDTGEDDFPPSSKQMKTLRYSESHIHDFAWFADKRFRVLKGTVKLPDSGREVTTWAIFTNQQANLWADAIPYLNSAIEYFSNWIGDYPYNSFTAVQSALSAGDGMEYPGIAVIGLAKDAYALDAVIAHEIGHSWFYSALGSDERRYPYLDEGITSTYEQRYINEKYPQKKLWENNVKNLKMAKFFHISQMPVKLMRELEWLAQARANFEQSINLAADEYNTLNYSLIIYNKAAMGFHYLRAYLGDSLFDSAMHDYYLQWKFRHPQPDDLRKVFEFHTGKDLSWFFSDFIGTTKRMDYEVVRLKDQKLLVKNNGELVSPLVISGMIGDSVCFEKWVDGFEGQKEIVIPEGNYSELKIDPRHVTPELFRLNNNIRTSGIFPKADPIQTQLTFTLEDPEKRYLMYIPALNWTRENGFMAGVAMHNGFLTPKSFEYLVMPFYTFSNPGLAGFGKISYNLLPYQKFIRKATISLEGTRFGAPGNQNYHKIKAGLDLYFRSGQLNNSLRQKAYGNVIAATNLFQIEHQEKAKLNSYLQFGYQLEKPRIINPFSLDVSSESSQSYLKTTAEFNYRISYYGMKKGLDIRFFAGAMLKNNPDIPFYALAPGGRSGPEQYLYLGAFPDRFSAFPTTFWSRQATFNEGGLVSPVNEKLGYSRWLISLSLTSILPGKTARIPVRPFVNFLLNDHGTGTGNNSHFFYEAGLKAGIWNFFEIYVPMAVSGNIKNITGPFKDRIRLIFKLDTFNQAKQNSGLGFQIR